MTKFKVGDKVRRINHDNDPSNVVGTEGVVTKTGRWVSFQDKKGRIHIGNSENNLELVEETHFPLYSEEEAVKLLTERGYEVKAPPGPLKGQFVVVMTPSGNPHAIARDRYDKKDYSLTVTAVLAIVDWTEGQGI